jgi:hypothetical protein
MTEYNTKRQNISVNNISKEFLKNAQNDKIVKVAGSV